LVVSFAGLLPQSSCSFLPSLASNIPNQPPTLTYDFSPKVYQLISLTLGHFRAKLNYLLSPFLLYSFTPIGL
jgi:hypothetical protein